MKRLISSFLVIVMLVNVLFSFDSCVFASDIYSNNNLSRAVCHDPSIVKDNNGRYYVFGSHIASAYSDDLQNWYNSSSTMSGDGTQSLLSYNGRSWKENCAKALDWTTTYQKAIGISEEKFEYNCWAPDVFFNKNMNKWCMYACCSVFGTSASVIFLATSDTIEGPYRFVDTMIYSGFTSELVANGSQKTDYNYTHTNVLEVLGNSYEKNIRNTKTGWFNKEFLYDNSLGKCPNCIDPTVFNDNDGNIWLTYGSFSGGIYVVPIVEQTGLVDYDYMASHKNEGYDVYFGKQITKTSFETEGTGEGPYIIYDSISEYYYLYLTYGGLSANDGYNIREYRSKNPDGPYYDKAGNNALDMKNTGVKLMGNYQFSCQPTAYLSSGHSSSFIDDDDKMYQVFHTRFSADGGWGHQIRVHQMLRTQDGWNVVLPYEYRGETVNNTGYSTDEIVGTYEFINHSSITNRLQENADISTIILPTQKIELAGDGNIYCLKDYEDDLFNTALSSQEISGKWKCVEGTYYAEFTVNSIVYKGVFCKQLDESSNGNEVMTFAAIGDNNCEIWGVQIDNHTPDFISVKTPATASSDGEILKRCSYCDISFSEKIPQIKSVALSQTSYVYDAIAKKPSVKVLDSNDNIISSDNYNISYINNVNSGTAKVKIDFRNNYSGSVIKTFTISRRMLNSSSATVSLSASTYTYDGKVKTPAVTVKNSKGKSLVKGTDYTVSYASGRKLVGKYAVKITFKGNYSGSVTKYFTIIPKNTTFSLTAGKNAFTAKLKKYTTQTTGYQIQYATNSKFTSAKTVSMKNTTTSKTISKLAGGKKYYVRVRTYRTVKINGKNTNIYSAWSKAKTVTTKK